MQIRLGLLATAGIALAAAALADTPKPFDAAAAFGARPSVRDLQMSPDGKSVAYISPTTGQGSAVYTMRLDNPAKATLALAVDGKPQRLSNCNWVSNERLVCRVFGVVRNDGALHGDIGALPFERLWAIDADGSNLKQLSTKSNAYTRGASLGGGRVIDWLPDGNGTVLMSREYMPDDRTGTRLASSATGLGVDLVDTVTLKVTNVEHPNPRAVEYLSDGRGAVRIMGANRSAGATGQDSGIIDYFYRTREAMQWQKLGEYSYLDRSGFEPRAIDHDLNVVYGFKKIDGRWALISLALDGSLHEQVVYARPDVDVDEIIQIGRRNRVVGISYATDYRHPVYFDAQIAKIVAALSKALPKEGQLSIADSSVDESKFLIFTSSDKDPGVYYVFDHQSHQLQTFLVARAGLEGALLAAEIPVQYETSDGTVVPGYLTLPPGSESAKGLPAIVMPHGGPGARDEWGFDWLAQFFAARGYAVLQPNFRGSTGYGDVWYQQNGFRSWPTAISDVLDAGRWLVRQGIADPAKLGIVGWSYGGYAALQSAVTDAGVFKAVVAIAPVTDLEDLKDDQRDWSNHYVMSQMIGDGPLVRAGSPAENAENIKVPVLLFHGALDRNVSISQSQRMAKSLEDAHVPHELVTWDDLDHQLEDSSARTDMLRKSDAFLRHSFGMQ